MGALGLGGKFKRAQQSNAATAGLFPTPKTKRPPSRPDGRSAVAARHHPFASLRITSP
jgi:hypothetical protein